MTDHEMSAEARSIYRGILVDKELMSLRSNYCRTVADQLATIAGWLGFDSFLGGGDIPQLGPGPSPGDGTPTPERYASFRGISAVVEMAAELGAGSVALLEAGLRYAAAALVRQLIEAEYFLSAFVDDISRAAEWFQASPDDIRRNFRPKTMRALGGFSDSEYRTHCDHGGHPSPHGQHLLRYGIYLIPANEDLLTAAAWGDLAQHLRRVWTATESLLSTHHARFTVVRMAEIDAVREVEQRWVARDPLATPIDLTSLNALVSSEQAT
jgi:hypothetical protein